MERALRATGRATNAIRKADALSRNTAAGFPANSSPPGNPARAGTVYSGPFQVAVKNNTTVTVKAYDGTSYLSKNYIIGGLERIEVSSDQDVTINTTGVVYIKIVYSSGYVATFHNALTLPDQVNGEYYLTLADVVIDGSNLTVNQVHYGQIHIAGRIVGS